MPTRKVKLISLPTSFSLDEHIVKFPPFPPSIESIKSGCYYSFSKFKKEKAYYFLGLLTSIPARNPDIVTKDGFVPINQKLVRDSIKDIKDYTNYLLYTGVIECDKHYIPDEKSFAYRWSEKYSLSKVSAKLIECKYDDYDTGRYAWQFEKYPYLFHWYQQDKLMIDDASDDYAFELYQNKMNDPTKRSWDLKNKGERKHPESQYRSAILNIAKIRHCCYEAHIDSNVHRLHSAFTGLGKKYRRFLTYGGEKLVGIDIKNSQPYIISLILNRDFWSENSSLPLSITNLPANIQEALKTPPELPAMIGKYFNSIEDNDFTDYITLASSGMFYERIVEIVNELGEAIERDDAKILMFYTMYSSNYLPKDSFFRQMRGIFKNMFPKVAELFKIIKRDFQGIDVEKQHNRLARLLQSIESEIVLHRCCQRIWIEGNQQVPVFTIHDNIVTTEGNEAFVQRIMTEELERFIGIAPPLSLPERWEEKYGMENL